VEFRTVQFHAADSIIRDYREWRCHPAVTAVERSGLRAAIRVVGKSDNRGALIWRLRENLHLARTAEPAEVLARTGSDEAREATQSLETAERLQVLVKDGVG